MTGETENGVARMRRPLTQHDLERMGLPKRFWKAEIDGVSDKAGVSGKIPPKLIVQRYISKMDDLMRRGVGLMLHGKNGVGKTGMTAVIAKEARRRQYSVLFLESASLKRLVISKEEFEFGVTVWERALEVNLLILDDLGKGVHDEKAFGESLLDELIRFRSSNLRATFISTNMTPGDFKEEHKPSTFEAMKECIIPVEVVGPDLRDGVKDELRELLAGAG